MKYYSEETVKEIIEDTVNATLHICKPKNDYPCIEIKEPHGRLIDADEVLDKIINGIYPDFMEYTTAIGIVEREIKNAPVILEATT